MAITRERWRGIKRVLPISIEEDEALEIEKALGLGPTHKELDEWAAMEVMGYKMYFSGWYGPDGAKMRDLHTWQPTRYLNQAIEVARKTEVNFTIDSVGGDIGVSIKGGNFLGEGDHSEEVAAEFIVRSLFESWEER